MRSATTQHLLGISERVTSLQRRTRARPTHCRCASESAAGGSWLRPACWAKQADSARHTWNRAMWEEALNAASAIGDDRLQKQSQGYVGAGRLHARNDRRNGCAGSSADWPAAIHASAIPSARRVFNVVKTRAGSFPAAPGTARWGISSLSLPQATSKQLEARASAIAPECVHGGAHVAASWVGAARRPGRSIAAPAFQRVGAHAPWNSRQWNSTA